MPRPVFDRCTDPALPFREKRAMPWRKVYDDSLSMQEKGQRAYEVRPYPLDSVGSNHY